MTSLRMRAVKGVTVGERFRVVRTFTEQDIVDFAAVSHDYNPVHFDRRFVEAKGFKGRICHGLLVGSLLTEIGGQLGWLATEMHFRFRRPVYVGDTVACELTVTRADEGGRGEAEARFAREDGTVVIEAKVKGNFPGRLERQIMEKMVEEGDPTNLRDTGRPEEQRDLGESEHP